MEQNLDNQRKDMQDQTQPNRNWLKVVFISLLGIIILSTTFYLGVRHGRDRSQKREQVETLPVPTTTKTTESVTPKSEWKLYEDGKIGYSIQYPDTWFSSNEVNDFTGGSSQILWLTTHKDVPNYQIADLGTGDNIRLTVIHSENKEGISLREEMSDHVRPDFADNPPEKIKSMWMTVGGLEAHRYIYYPGNTWGSPGVYTTIKMNSGDFIRFDAVILHEFDTYLNQVIEVEDSFKAL